MTEADILRLGGATWVEVGEVLGENPTKIRLTTLNELYKEMIRKS